MGAFNQLEWGQSRFFKAGPSALKSIWLGHLLTHRILVGCGFLFRKEGKKASGGDGLMGLFLHCGAGMRGTCCVCTSLLSEGKGGRGLGFEL